MTKCKCEDKPMWSRWMKRKDRNDHRQYRFCINCYKVEYREQ